MKKLYISILLAVVIIAGVATVVNTKSRDLPATIIATNSWDDQVLNNSLLAEKSDSIVIGQVKEVLPSRWNTPDGKKPEPTDKMPASKEESEQKQKENNIYTDVIIKVDQQIKNKSTPAEVIVRTLGGKVGVDEQIEDDAKFEVGEKVLLFLTKEDPFTDNSAGTHYRITGWKFGKFSITMDNQAVRPDIPTEYQHIPLEELLKSIGAQ